MSDMDYQQRLTTTGRNDPCPCGSGKKYKKCHLSEDEAKRTAALKALEEEAKAKAAAEAEEAEANGETDPKAAPKGSRAAQRRKSKAQGGSKGKGGNARATNIPRRGAV